MHPVLILLTGMAVVVGGVLGLRMHAFLALMAGAIVVAALTSPAQVGRWANSSPSTAREAKRLAAQTPGERVADGFGSTAGKVGILIAMASIVGRCLMESGAAERVVCSTRRLLGDHNAPLAFLISGFALGSLIFSDTVFYLLIPLGKVMRLRSGKDYTLYILSIVAGSTMTHALVPPTPGPSTTAATLGVPLAVMIPCGLVVGAVAAAGGYAYARFANARWDLPLRATAGLTEAELHEISARDESTLPPLWLSLLPLLLPVTLISTGAIANAAKASGPLARVAISLGNPTLALSLAAAASLLMLATVKKHTRRQVSLSVGEAVASAGVIILIIAAGGAFGLMLQQTSVADSIQSMLPKSRFALIPLAFLTAVVIRTAQGSATVSMITVAGIIAPIAQGVALPFHPVYLALAIGCGSKPGMWMNDSGFWIIGRMSGFTEAETLKTATIMMSIMGVVGLCVTLLGAWLVPMVN